MSQEYNEINNMFLKELNTNLISIILGGSRGKNNEINNWSDYDLYLVLKEISLDDIIKIREINKNLEEKLNCHVGITYYTEQEIKNKNIDDKTFVMLYEKNNFNCNPTLYGNLSNINISYYEILEIDQYVFPQIVNEVKRNILLNDYKKIIKKVTLLIKIILRKNNIFCYGYENIFMEFYSLMEKKKIDFINKIDILECILTNDKKIIFFATELLKICYNL